MEKFKVVATYPLSQKRETLEFTSFKEALGSFNLIHDKNWLNNPEFIEVELLQLYYGEWFLIKTNIIG